MPASDLEVVHNQALAMFEAAEVVLRGTQTQNPKIILAKRALYQAETIDEYMAAAKLFKGTSSQKPRIQEGSRLVKAAADKVAKAAGKTSSGARPVLAAVDIDDISRASPAAGSRAGGAAAKQAASPAAASPQKKASPAAAAAVKHEASPAAAVKHEASPAPAFPRMPLTARVVESAPAHVSLLDRSARVVLSAAQSVKLDLMTFVSKMHPMQPEPQQLKALAPSGGAAPAAELSDDDKPLKPRRKKRAAAGGVPKPAQKRPAAEVPKQAADDIIVIGSSDEDDDKGKQPAPAGGAAKSVKPVKADDDKGKQPAPAGGAAKSVKPVKPDKVVYGQNDGYWTSAVIDIMSTLKKRGLYSFQELNTSAEDQLCTLPEHVALECLGEFLKEENVIGDANEFLVQRAELLRTEHGIEPVFNVYAQMAADANDTESDDE
jgi:hypothetical protein